MLWQPRQGLIAGRGAIDGAAGAGPSAETTAFLARTSGLDATHTNAYTALIDGLVSDGVFAKLDVLHVYATQDTTTAQLNLVSTSFPATLNGAPSFTADRGYTGVDLSSTVYINTGFNPSTASSPKYVQNSAHLSVWNLTNVAKPNSDFGSATAGNASYLSPRYDGDGLTYFRINLATTGVDAVSVGTANGHSIGNRDTSSTMDFYRNGAHQGAQLTSRTSAAPSNLNMYSLGINNNGTASGIAHQHAMISIGSSLSAGDVTAFYNRLRSYMTAVGVP